MSTVYTLPVPNTFDVQLKERYFHSTPTRDCRAFWRCGKACFRPKHLSFRPQALRGVRRLLHFSSLRVPPDHVASVVIPEGEQVACQDRAAICRGSQTSTGRGGCQAFQRRMEGTSSAFPRSLPVPGAGWLCHLFRRLDSPPPVGHRVFSIF